jgi:dTDP-4-amino-4,6-dideoxygalactose transaminase
VKLRHLGKGNARRAAIAALYDRALAGVDVTTPPRRPGAGHVYHQYVIRAAGRDQLRQQLQAAGIGTLIHYPVPVHLQPAFRGQVPMVGTLPNTEEACRHILSLPMFPELTDAQAERCAGGVSHLQPGRRSA